VKQRPQVLEPDKSCHNAVSRVISYLVAEKVELPSTDSSAYCQARSLITRRILGACHLCDE
jgi:hypothetical protein